MEDYRSWLETGNLNVASICVLLYKSAYIRISDQNAHMPRLICTFVVSIYCKRHNLTQTGPYDDKNTAQSAVHFRCFVCSVLSVVSKGIYKIIHIINSNSFVFFLRIKDLI